MEVVRRRTAFEEDAHKFVHQWDQEQDKLREKIRMGQDLLLKVEEKRMCCIG